MPVDSGGANPSPGAGTSLGDLLISPVTAVRERPSLLGVLIVGGVVPGLPNVLNSIVVGLFLVVCVMIAGGGFGLQMAGGVGDRFVIGVIAYFLSAIGIAIGLLLLILPGLYLWAKFYLAVPAAVFGGAGPVSSLSESFALTDGALWSILGALLVFVGGGVVVGIVASIATGGVLLGTVCTTFIVWGGLAGSQAYLYREAVQSRSPYQQA